MEVSRHTTRPGFPYAVNAGIQRESSALRLLYWVFAECRRKSMRRCLPEKNFRQADARPESIKTDLIGLVTYHGAIWREQRRGQIDFVGTNGRATQKEKAAHYHF
jgi:hypothetical protein